MPVELLVLGLIAVTITACAVLGAFSFMRMGRYREALVEAERRIRSLESAVQSGVPAQIEAAAEEQQIVARAATAGARKPVVPLRLLRPERPERVVAPPPPPIAQPSVPPPAAPLVERFDVPPPLPPEPDFAPFPSAAPRDLPPTTFDEPKATPAAPPPAEERAPRPKPSRPRIAKIKISTRGPSPLWAVWAGGAAIAVAVVAFLRFAYERHFFSQAGLLLVGLSLGGGLIVAAEILRRRQPANAPMGDWQARHAPSIAAACGLVCLYGMAWVSYRTLGLVSQPVAVAGLGAASLLGVGLAFRQGRAVGWLGLLGGFATPLVVGYAHAPAGALFSYLVAIAAAGFYLAERRRWPALAAGAATGALAWAVYWMATLFVAGGAFAASAYLAAVAALGAAYAARDLEAPIFADGAISLRDRNVRAWVGMATLVLAVAALAALFAVGRSAGGSPAPFALAVLALCLALTAALREGFAPLALLTAAAALGCIGFWPPFAGQTELQRFATSAGMLGFSASVGGWIMIGKNRAPIFGAALAGFVPTLTLLAAELRMGRAIGAPWMWGAAAIFFAILNGAALFRLARPTEANRAGAVNVFAAAAAIGAIMAGAFSVAPAQLGAATALLLPALAFIDRKLALPGLRVAAIVVAALSLALLSPLALLNADLARTPLLNAMTLAFLVAIAAFFTAARFFDMGPSGHDGQAAVAVRVGFVALVFFAGWAEIRHLGNAGLLSAPYRSLWEAGGHTIFLAAVALAARVRSGPDEGPLRRRTELFACAGALTHAAAAGLVWLNPWWGLEPAKVAGGAVNALLPAYLAPAALFCAYAYARRADQGLAPKAALAGGLLFTSTWATLAVRHAFHPGPAMSAAAISGPENAAYTGLLLLVAAGLGGAAFVRREMRLLLLSAIVAAFAFLKAMFLDAAAISDLLPRAAASTAIALAAGGAGYLYLRLAAPGLAKKLVALIPARAPVRRRPASLQP